MSGCLEMVGQDALNAVTSSINESNSTETAWFSSLTATPVMLEEEVGSVSTISSTDLSAAQQEDTTISRVLHFMQNRKRPTYQEKQQETAVVRQFLHEWNRLFLSKMEFSRLRNQIVLPKQYRKRVYEELHENMGHLGADRVIELARECFYWPFMRADFTHYVTKVCQCLKQRKPAVHFNAPLQPIISTGPFQLVSMDFVNLEPSSIYTCNHGPLHKICSRIRYA